MQIHANLRHESLVEIKSATGQQTIVSHQSNNKQASKHFPTSQMRTPHESSLEIQYLPINLS